MLDSRTAEVRAVSLGLAAVQAAYDRLVANHTDITRLFRVNTVTQVPSMRVRESEQKVLHHVLRTFQDLLAVCSQPYLFAQLREQDVKKHGHWPSEKFGSSNSTAADGNSTAEGKKARVEDDWNIAFGH